MCIRLMGGWRSFSTSTQSPRVGGVGCGKLSKKCGISVLKKNGGYGIIEVCENSLTNRYSLSKVRPVHPIAYRMNRPNRGRFFTLNEGRSSESYEAFTFINAESQWQKLQTHNN